MNPEELPRDDVLGRYYRNILESYNIPPERISSFFNRAIQLYWYLLGEQGDVVDVGIHIDYDHIGDILNMSFDFPPFLFPQERRDLIINMEEFSADLANHIKTEIILEIAGELLSEVETVAIEATLYNLGQLFFPSELVVQIDEDEKNAYYFLKYGRDGMLYTIEAMDPELSSLLGDDYTVDEVNILTLTDMRDVQIAADYINNQFEGVEAKEPAEYPIVQADRPLNILYTLTCLAQSRLYNLAPNGIKIPALIYK